jgi:oxygen-independent coproporphyrinogen-3 oxidase
MVSLYIHIPYCVRKCLYCGFYSTVYDPNDAEEFLSALSNEAKGYETEFNSRSVGSVYIGGGTPTVLSTSQLGRVIAIVRNFFLVSPSAEWTVEANPNSLSEEILLLLLKEGINRLSLGVQSFSDDLLEFLGRLHSAREAEDAFKRARTAGFKNIGVDLIYAIPGQDRNQWLETLDRTIDIRPEHVSAYSLSLDEGSGFHQTAAQGRLVLPDDKFSAELYETATEELQQAGYEHYEISNFARPGFACHHNINYWDRGEYIGLGPGAWSFLGNRRYKTIADVRTYIKRVKAGDNVQEGMEIINSVQAANERVMLALRTSRGLDIAQYKLEFGSQMTRLLEEKIAALKDSGLLSEQEGSLRLTKRGFLLSNAVLERLLL